MRGLTLERIVQFIEQGKRSAIAGLEKEKLYLAIAQALVRDGRGYLPNGIDLLKDDIGTTLQRECSGRMGQISDVR